MVRTDGAGIKPQVVDGRPYACGGCVAQGVQTSVTMVHMSEVERWAER